jgi:hypothetical protein
MKNKEKTKQIEFKAYVLLIIFSTLQVVCTIPPRPATSWNRYQQIQFSEVLSQFQGYLDFTEENTIRIFSPANAFQSVFRMTINYSELSEEEIMVLIGKYHNEMTEQLVRQTYKHKAQLKANNQDGWFCFQESIFSALATLEPGISISVLYQFAGSTNSNSNPRLVFAALGWSE